MSRIRKFLDYIIHSELISTSLTLVTFSFYCVVLGVSLLPSFYLLYYSINWLLAGITLPKALLFCFTLPAAAYAFFITAAIVFGVIERLITWGMKPGRYPPASLTFVRWLINGGLHTVALNTFLPFVQGTAIYKMFLRLCGCKIGKDVFINTKSLHDVYLLTLHDGVVIGGATDITCHLFENGMIVLDNIEIGKGSLIGASCRIGPGIHIGEDCTIGINSYVRRGRKIEDGSVLISLPALPIRYAMKLMNIKERPASKEQ